MDMILLSADERAAIDLWLTSWPTVGPPTPPDPAEPEWETTPDEWAEYCAHYDQDEEMAAWQERVHRRNAIVKLLTLHDIVAAPLA